ncbi:polysaccharide deacetylase family protein [Fluviispira vulneris]|uniref:polysaccharide deacetylase family protein n=1 Tax=Fluviispira vulneris TaxID=2763012 RepID=UPI00164520B7|nr:polysaccharide deacetylase family protein [Fluviispira vulneris]
MRGAIKDTLAVLYFNIYRKYINIKGCRVLLYHAFGTELQHDNYGISIDLDTFESHLKILKNISYFLKFSELINKEVLNKNSICLTFDDGYEDNMLAADILCELSIPFTIFITTDFIGKKYFFTKEQLRRVSEMPFCEIGAHTKSHPILANQTIKVQRNELLFSKNYLEDLLGHRITSMTYPHGSYTNETINLVKECGYSLSGCSISDINTLKNYNPYLIRRTEIIKRDDSNLFNKKINGYYDYLFIRKYF